MWAGPRSVHPPVHDALKDGGKGGDANACPDEHGVLRGEDPAGGGSVRAIDVALGTGVRGKRTVGRAALPALEEGPQGLGTLSHTGSHHLLGLGPGLGGCCSSTLATG